VVNALPAFGNSRPFAPHSAGGLFLPPLKRPLAGNSPAPYFPNSPRQLSHAGKRKIKMRGMMGYLMLGLVVLAVVWAYNRFTKDGIAMLGKKAAE